MFASIRNLFRNALSILQGPGWRFDDMNYVEITWPEISGRYYDVRYENLTQRDSQMLQKILSWHIKAADQVRKDLKEEALEYEVGDDLRNILFKEHREVKAYLRKLAALQHRLKHRIATRY